jgi:hypothetical protein
VIRTPDVTRTIHEMIWTIKQKIRKAIDRLQVELLIAENCVTIPMNIPMLLPRDSDGRIPHGRHRRAGQTGLAGRRTPEQDGG